MADPSPPPTPGDRIATVLKVGLVVLATAVLALVGVAQTNPWHLTALSTLSRAPVTLAVVALAVVLYAVVVALAYVPGSRATMAAVAASLVGVTAVCVGLPLVMLHDPFHGSAENSSAVAVSPAGAYEVVKTLVDDPAQTMQLHVRSRRGLLSRQAAVPIATCTFDLFAQGTPPEAVHFTSETTLALPVQGGPSIVVEFNPDTLQPEHTLSLCGQG